jgi:Tol biopolymer transport system component/DNA-binding winged helix-turn-helix (wHTH) protein
MALAIKHFCRFGEFTVDSDQRVLLRNDSPVPLAPKVFETLLVLVGNSGRIVEKEELMSRLWPETFVEESNLTFNIKQLRKALGDNARQPRFIETVARRGYRFIAEVTENCPAPLAVQTESGRASSTASAASPKRSYLTVATLAFLLVGSIAIAMWFMQGIYATSAPSVPILSRPFKAAKFASTGNQHAVLTPDGKYVAYTSETGGKHSVWLRELETSENIQIVPPSDERYLGLAISHDGKSIYLVRKSETDPPSSAIYRVMTFGGIPAKVVGKTEGWISVSPDDKQISFVRCNYEDNDFCSLFVIDADGRNEQRLLTRQRPFRIGDNQFSPDGKSIAFAAGQSWNGGSDFRLMLLDVTSGAEREISRKTFFNISNLKWLPGGDSLLLTANESLNGRFRIWRVSVGAEEVKPLTDDAIDYLTISIDTAANKMIATRLSDSFHLYLAGLDDVGKAKPLAVARSGLAFAPDGKVFYTGGDGDVWMISRDGGEQRQLTNSPFNDFHPRVSPDGRYVFFTSNRTGSNQVWRMNSDGTNQVQLTRREGGFSRFITPDGKWVYFESGVYQTLWRVPAEGGEETEVWQGRVYGSSLSPDGILLAYFFRAKDSDNRLRIAVMSIENRTILKTFAVAGDTFNRVEIAWMNDNQSFYYVSTSGGQNLLWLQALDNEGPAHLVANLGDEEIADFAMSGDGNNLAFVRGQWIHEAVLLEGFR